MRNVNLSSTRSRKINEGGVRRYGGQAGAFPLLVICNEANTDQFPKKTVTSLLLSTLCLISLLLSGRKTKWVSINTSEIK